MADTFFSSTVDLIRKAADGGRMMQLVRQLVDSDRWNSFDQFKRTTRTIVDGFEAAGATSEVHTIQTGGAVGSGRWIIQQAADIRGATCEVISPVRLKLLDYQDCPWHVIQWSAATPPEGLSGQLVVIDDEEQLAGIKPGGLSGKIVLTSKNVRTFAVAGDPGAMPRLASLGAVAVICDRPIPNLPDAVGWTKFGWGGIDLPYAAFRLVGLAISQNQGLALRQLLQQHGELTLRIKADIHTYVGSHDVICGVVRGQDESQSEVWSVAHSNEPGAVDNASGVAVSIEAARMLEALISAGQLPRPKRSIRLLASYECYGFFHYLEHVKRRETPLAGLCIDGVGSRPDICGGRLQWHDTVPQSASFVNALGERVLRATLRTGNPGYHIYRRPFVATLDTLLGDPQYGFPCPWLENHYQKDGKPYNAYHSSADVPELLCDEGLEVAATAAAAYLYYLANAGNVEALDLARRETNQAVRQLRQTSAPFGREEIDYIRAAHQQNLVRLKRWLSGEKSSDSLAAFARLQSQVDDAARLIMPAARRRVRRGRADRRVPKRTAPLTPTAENMPQEISQRIKQSGLRVWALFWADGQLDLSEIAARLSVEMQRPVTVDQVAQFFEAHADLDYLQLADPQQNPS